jgi:hypothetical protein
MFLINNCLKDCVEKIRLFKYTDYDLILENIIESLYGIEGVTYFEDSKNDNIVFALPLTKVKSNIFYDCKDYSLYNLVNFV